MDLGDWLRNLGLGQYEATFRENEIDTDVLPELTEIDLEKLGVCALWHFRLAGSCSLSVGGWAPSGAANSGRPVLADGWADFFWGALAILFAIPRARGAGRFLFDLIDGSERWGSLAYVYFADEAGRLGGAPAEQRRGAAHRRQHRQAAGAVAADAAD